MTSAVTARPRRLQIPSRGPARLGPSSGLRSELFWVVAVYLAAHALLLAAAVALDALGHVSLQSELANWDGQWYRSIALHGYPHTVSHRQSNLGFFPLFPLAVRLVAWPLRWISGAGPVWAATYAGVLVSTIGGLVATVVVQRLAEGWWDRAIARRATVAFIVFPGAVVFTMVYSEGLLIPLAAVCIWALERRRFLLAGVAAGLGTAVQPIGLVLGLVCAVCAARELWRHGPRSGEFARALTAAVLSSAGVLAFLAFLWAWTGDPFASYTAQADGWGHTSPSLIALVRSAAAIVPPANPHHHYPRIDVNHIVSTADAVLMFVELWLLWRSRRELSLPAIVWSLGIAWFAFFSVPAMPRVLITMFPMVMLLGRWTRPSRAGLLLGANTVLFLFLSLLTYYRHVLRP